MIYYGKEPRIVSKTCYLLKKFYHCDLNKNLTSFLSHIFLTYKVGVILSH